MPITKKSGAIFTIYADTPTPKTPRASSSREPSQPAPTPSANKPSKSRRDALTSRHNTMYQTVRIRGPSASAKVDLAKLMQPTAEMKGEVADQENLKSLPAGRGTMHRMTIPTRPAPPPPGLSLAKTLPKSAIRPATKDDFRAPINPNSPSTKRLRKAQLDAMLRGAGDRADDLKDLANMLGDGHGYLFGRKTWHISEMINDPELRDIVLASEEPASAPMAKSGRSSKGASIPGDEPLQDVSEAYGAGGDVPDGFRA